MGKQEKRSIDLWSVQKIRDASGGIIKNRPEVYATFVCAIIIASAFFAGAEPVTFPVGVSNAISGTVAVVPLTFQATSNGVERIADGKAIPVQILPIPKPTPEELPWAPETPFEALLYSIQVPAIQFEEMSISNAVERLTQVIVTAWGEQEIELKFNVEFYFDSPYNRRWRNQLIHPFDIQATNVVNVCRQFAQKMRVQGEEMRGIEWGYTPNGWGDSSDESRIFFREYYGDDDGWSHRAYRVHFMLRDSVIEKLDEIRAQLNTGTDKTIIKESYFSSLIVVEGLGKNHVKFEKWLSQLIDELSAPESFEFVMCDNTLFLKGGLFNKIFFGLWRYHAVEGNEGMLCERFEPCLGQDELRTGNVIVGPIAFNGHTFALHSDSGGVFKLYGSEFVSLENERMQDTWTPLVEAEDYKKAIDPLLGAIIMDEINLRQAPLSEAIEKVQSAINQAGAPTNDLRIIVKVDDDDVRKITISARYIAVREALHLIEVLSDTHITYPAPNEVQVESVAASTCLFESIVTLPKAVRDEFPTVEFWENELSSFVNRRELVSVDFEPSSGTLTMKTLSADAMNTLYTVLNFYMLRPNRYHFDIEREDGKERLMVVDTYFDKRYLIMEK